MAIGPISSHDLYPLGLQDRLRQGSRDFQWLARALNSGDLAGAQKAFEAFKQDIQTIQRIQTRQQPSQPLPDHQPFVGKQTATTEDTHIGTIIDVIV